MKTRIYTHSSGLNHDTGNNHPECAARLETLNSMIDDLPDKIFEKVSPPKINHNQIVRAHSSGYLDQLESKGTTTESIVMDGGDTIMSSGSLDAAYHAAGAVCQAADDIASGDAMRVFCMNRPPGHHAEPDHAMGFCFLNNIFLGALQAKSKGFEKIAIVDFDVHHGNGTDSMTRNCDGGIFFVSSHEWPLFPNTGNPENNIPEVILNVTLPNRSGSSFFRQKYKTEIFPALEKFSPDILMISAGFDGHKDDHLSTLMLEDDDYDWVMRHLIKIANTHSAGRIISVLEGGYNLEVLERCVGSHIKALSETG